MFYHSLRSPPLQGPSRQRASREARREGRHGLHHCWVAGGLCGLGKFRSRGMKDIATRVGPATEVFFNSTHRGKPSGSYCFCSRLSCVWFRCTAGVAAETAAV